MTRQQAIAFALEILCYDEIGVDADGTLVEEERSPFVRSHLRAIFGANGLPCGYHDLMAKKETVAGAKTVAFAQYLIDVGKALMSEE